MPDDDDVVRAALDVARHQGCDCQPDISLVELVPGVGVASVRHDDWCRFLRMRQAPAN